MSGGLLRVWRESCEDVSEATSSREGPGTTEVVGSLGERLLMVRLNGVVSRGFANLFIT